MQREENNQKRVTSPFLIENTDEEIPLRLKNHATPKQDQTNTPPRFLANFRANFEL